MSIHDLFPLRLAGALRKFLASSWTLSSEYGHFRSTLRRDSVDGRGNPIPWMTYPAIEYLNSLDLSSLVIFEYGTGNSTQFWSKKCESLVSVESSRGWYDRVSSRIPKNVELMYAASEAEYVDSIASTGHQFDIIVIDGKWRNACLLKSREFLADGGLVILDNSDRHYESANILKEQGFVQVDFSGFCPINSYTATTSIFFECNNRILGRAMPPTPVGGLEYLAKPDD